MKKPVHLGTKSKIVIFSLLVMLVIIVVVVIAMPRKPPSPYLLKILQNPTCELPCWEYITPGVTDISEVTSLLSTVPGLNSIDGPRYYSITNRWTVSWDFEDGSGGLVVSATDGRSVDNIILGFERPIRLKEFVEVYGEPTYIEIFSSESPRFYTVYLIYPELGVKLSFGMTGNINRVRVSPNLKVTGIEISSPDDYTPEMIRATRDKTWYGFSETYHQNR